MINSNQTYFTIKSIVILLGITMLLSCENNIKEVNSLTSNENLPLQEGKNVEFIYTDSTKIIYRAYAPLFHELVVDKEKINEFAQGGKIISYKNDSIDWTIKANFARNYVAPQLWELRNNVVATNKNGQVINTELMFWDQKKDSIYSNQYVRITTKDGQILEGINFHTNGSMDKISLQKGSGEGYFKN